MSRRASNLLALAVVVTAALALFGPALMRREVFTFRDHADYFQPLRVYTAQHLRAGRLPLWNPYNASGEPWMANPQTGVFYPPAWVFVFLPFPTAYVAYLMLHSLLLGGGAWMFFSRRASAGPALVGTVALMFSGPVISLLDVSNNFTTFAWLPLLLWRAERDRDDPRPLAAGVLLALSFLAGEPFYAAVAALLYAVVVRRWRTVVIAGACAVGLAAVQLVPFLEMVAGSNRVGGFATADVLRASMPLEDWVWAALPPRFGRSAQTFIFVVYAGCFVAALALVGAAGLAARRQWRTLAGWVAMLAGSMLVAAGPDVIVRLPLTLFRYPARVVPFGVFALVALAVAGWEQARRGSWVVDAVVILAIAIDLSVAVRPLLRSAPLAGPWTPYGASIGRDRKVLQAYGDISLRGGSRAAWMSGYLNLFDLRFAALTAAPVTSARYMVLYHESLRRLDVAREMGVGWVLAAGALPRPFEPVASAEGVIAYRLPGALPMAYVREDGGAVTSARALALDASRATVRVKTARGGLLVLTQNDAPGWRVKVDGNEAAGERVLGTFRAVRVPPGAHEVVWRYAPASFRFGAAMTAATLFLMLLLARRA